ncbi:MAG: dihydropyrimidine dehydrogenase [Sneathiella sp.]|jgi:glutamate synthase (NADPH/NADH) small chain|uniref:NAD(P)-dependent oxidoreductase n=1 Tax=Sneathiella sp. TaxID=1964365 RepID=UPI000C4227A0|nr:NAD(P)-dependent oxidoreductase [Sneathiella sp.]MAL79042.1 dihydropyrimidine dehydrogenase [Sneathiella sp.]
MTEKMLKFVSLEKKMPPKRAADNRRQDFNEIYDEFDQDRAKEQASRCSQCGIPFCQVHCPVQNNIPDWLMMTAAGRLEEAYEVSQATNNFPEICGRICPQDRLCEGSCVIEKGFNSVTIGAVEKYITDTAWENGWVKPTKPVVEREQSVGVIGAGPGGLAAADQLRKKGYQVHVYDRYDRAGGLMIYGIPGFKLEKEVVERRSRLLQDSGITFHLNFEVGRDATLAELRERHDAIVIATGVYKSRDIAVPGSGLGGIVPALEYLTASNRKGLGDDVPAFEDGTLNATGKNVVVIGGGDTAMDCVRTAVRQGAKSVKCLYRRDRKNMPGSLREVVNAEEEGVEFVWLSAPKAFLGDTSVTSVRAIDMHLGIPDSTGRQVPVEIDGSEHDIPCDLAIKALGFDAEDIPTLFNEPKLDVSRWGTISVNFKTAMTNLDGVFAVGDIVRGASLVVWAIRDGRDAAASVHQYLEKRAASEKRALAS